MAWTFLFRTAQTRRYADFRDEHGGSPPALVECRGTLLWRFLALSCFLSRGSSRSRGWVAPPRNPTTRSTARPFLGENQKESRP